MLADFLAGQSQELVRSVERRAAEDGGPGAATGREARIKALVSELIEALRNGSVSRPSAPTGSVREAARECKERDLVRQETLAAVIRDSPAVGLREMVVLSDWAGAAERRRLREEAKRLSDLLDDVPEMTVIVSPEARIEYVNRAAASRLREATGFPFDQLVGKTLVELGLPRASDVSREADVIVALGRRQAVQIEFTGGRWNEAKYRAIYSEGGDVAAVAFTSQDIHEPTLARARLELLSKLHATVGVDYENVAEALASVPIPELADWCIVNLVEERCVRRTIVTQADPAKAALREAAMRAMPDWSSNPLWTEMRLTSGFQLLSDVSDELLRKIALSEEQYRVLSQAGVRSLMVQPVVLRGKVVAILTLMYTTESGRRYGRDDPPLAAELSLHAAQIIENALLLRDLRSTEARFRVSLAGAKTVVFEQDESLRYRWHYDALAPHSFKGRTEEEAFPAEEAALLKGLKRGVLEEGSGFTQELALTMGGERRIFRESVEATRDQCGKIVGVIGSATDITEEKRMQEHLREAIDFRDRVTGVLGHDLRNPLTAVTTAATAVLKQDTSEAVREKARVIQRAAGRMTEMINSLCDLTRVQATGRLPVSRAPTDLAGAARDVVEETCTAWPDRRVDLDLKGNLAGRWDPARLEQAMSNLLANGLQHGDPRKPVSVSLDGTGEEVVLKVRNDGPPIPSYMLPVLFEPFSRGEASPHGLGLGLFVVKQIIVAHDGMIDVESTPEKGTAFTVRLPRAERAA
jgi:PAS domain S-box-containing protein